MRRLNVIEDDCHVSAVAAQRGDMIQLVRCDADGVANVRDAVRNKLLCFLQRRDGDTAGLTVEREPRDVIAFCRLDVRSERDAELGEMLMHAPKIALQLAALEYEAGCFELMQFRHIRLHLPLAGQTLKRKCMTSPSRTIESLPSSRILPASFAPCSPL